MNGYYEDEYEYEDDDYAEPEISETKMQAYLGKAKNGHLYTQDVFGWKYRGQDWGETVDQWEVTTYRLNEIEEWIRKIAIRWGRNLAPGEVIEFPYWLCEEGDENEGELDNAS